MKAACMFRNMDSVGRIVLPISLRRRMDLEIGGPIEIFVEDDYVLVKKYVPQCVLCGSKTEIKIFQGKNICNDCIHQISENL